MRRAACDPTSETGKRERSLKGTSPGSPRCAAPPATPRCPSRSCRDLSRADLPLVLVAPRRLQPPPASEREGGKRETRKRNAEARPFRQSHLHRTRHTTSPPPPPGARHACATSALPPRRALPRRHSPPAPAPSRRTSPTTAATPLTTDSIAYCSGNVSLSTGPVRPKCVTPGGPPTLLPGGEAGEERLGG